MPPEQTPTDPATPQGEPAAAADAQAAAQPAAQAQQPAAQADSETAALRAPEKYEAFTLAEGALDASETAAVEKAARELDLTQQGAQRLAEMRAADKAAAATQASEALKAARSGWVEQAMADTDIGGDKMQASLAVAKKALTQFDPEGKLAPLLESTGFGDHPDVIRFMHRIGLAISEDRFVPANGAASAATKSLAQRMFPNMNS